MAGIPLYERPVTQRFTVKGAQEPEYSSHIRAESERLGVLGYVRVNLWDGRSEVFVEGEADRVAELSEAIRTGPDDSSVTVLQEGPEYMQLFRDFRVY
jgi:acylphosphatase